MRRPRRPTGFTLLELLVATTIAIIVVGAATMTILLLLRTLTRTGQSSTADAEAQLVHEFLATQLQGIGGGAVRPWMAFALENNAAGGSDVVHFADIPADVPAAVTVIEHLGDGRYSFFLVNDGVGRCGLADLRRDVDGDGFPEAADANGAAFTRDDLTGHEVILTSPTGESWRSVVVEDVGLGSDATSCFVAFATDDRGLVANGALCDADTIARNADGDELLDQWVFGQLSFVRARTWRPRAVTGGPDGALAIVETLHTSGDPVERTIFEGLRSLQLAVGYDHAPTDGVVRVVADGVDDEWLGNAVDEVDNVPRDLPAHNPPVPMDALRMLRIDVVTALPRGENVRRLRALDGPVVSGPEARVTTAQVYLRNLLLFL
jgi:hypothetical protein